MARSILCGCVSSSREYTPLCLEGMAFKYVFVNSRLIFLSYACASIQSVFVKAMGFAVSLLAFHRCAFHWSACFSRGWLCFALHGSVRSFHNAFLAFFLLCNLLLQSYPSLVHGFLSTYLATQVACQAKPLLNLLVQNSVESGYYL